MSTSAQLLGIAVVVLGLFLVNLVAGVIGLGLALVLVGHLLET